MPTPDTLSVPSAQAPGHVAPPRNKRGDLLLPARQFLEWFAALEARHDRRLRLEARLAGSPIKPSVNSGAQTAALCDIGWGDPRGSARLRDWRSGRCTIRDGVPMVAIALLADALWHSNTDLAELYPRALYPWAFDTTTPASELFCPTCADEVLAVSDAGRLICPWCERPLERPQVPDRPAPPPPARWPVLRLIDNRPPRVMVDEAMTREAVKLMLANRLCLLASARVICRRHPGVWANPESLVPTLKLALERRELLVPGTRAQVRASRKLASMERRRMRAFLNSRESGMTYRGSLPPAVIWEAAWLYFYDGWGFQRIAAHLKLRDPALTRARAHSLGNRLKAAFTVNGWPLRSAAQASETRAAAATCRELTKKGARCRNVPAPGSTKCSVHNRQAAPPARRDHRDLVDSGPFIAWLRARYLEAGGQRELGALTGVQKATIGKLLRTGGTTNPGRLTRSYIERVLATTLETAPDQLVPRFSDLYEITAPEPAARRPPAPAESLAA